MSGPLAGPFTGSLAGPFKKPGGRGGANRGFTLIELVITLALLATVLTVAYRILTNILDTEREVNRRSTPEKIGQGILTLLRRDLLGVMYHHLGERVFQIVDNGEGLDAQDAVEFFTTVATMNPETLSGQLDAAGFSLDFLESFNSINAVRWYLEENPTARATRLFVLFRKECIDFEGNDPFEGAGVSYEIYDKMRGLSVEAFDGYQWYRVWDSQTNLALEAEELAEEEVLGADRSNVTATLDGIDDLSEQDLDPMAALEEQLKPPVAVPVAVRISITFLAGDEKGAYVVRSGDMKGEFQEFTYTTIVPILSALRVPISQEEEMEGEEGLLGDEGDATGGDSRSGSSPGGSSGSSTTPGRKPVSNR